MKDVYSTFDGTTKRYRMVGGYVQDSSLPKPPAGYTTFSFHDKDGENVLVEMKKDAALSLAIYLLQQVRG